MTIQMFEWNRPLKLVCFVFPRFWGSAFSLAALLKWRYNRVFSHDVMAARFVSQNNETAAIFVSQTSPVGVELFSYVNAFFCSNKFA